MYGRRLNSEFTDRLGESALARERRGRDALRSSTALSDWLGRLPALVMGASLVGAGTAQANPEDPTVVSGAATITNTSDTRLDIQQTTDRAIINWRAFSIAVDEHTNFDMPSSSSV